MKNRRLATGLFLSMAMAMALPSQLNPRTALAVELADGTTAFIRPPQFLEATTTNNRVMRRNATYFFTLDLPADADAPLQSVVIAPQNLARHLWDYHLDETVAFAGTPQAPLAGLGVGEVSLQDDTKTVTVVFDPPVAPGQLVTVGLRPERNPRLDGIYVFRVTAIPQGDQPRTHIAGHGRLNFIGRDRDRRIY